MAGASNREQCECDASAVEPIGSDLVRTVMPRLDNGETTETMRQSLWLPRVTTRVRVISFVQESPWLFHSGETV